jgi:hypothetical protein
VCRPREFRASRHRRRFIYGAVYLRGSKKKRTTLAGNFKTLAGNCKKQKPHWQAIVAANFSPQWTIYIAKNKQLNKRLRQ